MKLKPICEGYVRPNAVLPKYFTTFGLLELNGCFVDGIPASTGKLTQVYEAIVELKDKSNLDKAVEIDLLTLIEVFGVEEVLNSNIIHSFNTTMDIRHFLLRILDKFLRKEYFAQDSKNIVAPFAFIATEFAKSLRHGEFGYYPPEPNYNNFGSSYLHSLVSQCEQDFNLDEPIFKYSINTFKEILKLNPSA
jgi:hypothetical protein